MTMIDDRNGMASLSLKKMKRNGNQLQTFIPYGNLGCLDIYPFLNFGLTRKSWLDLSYGQDTSLICKFVMHRLHLNELDIPGFMNSKFGFRILLYYINKRLDASGQYISPFLCRRIDLQLFVTQSKGPFINHLDMS